MSLVANIAISALASMLVVSAIAVVVATFGVYFDGEPIYFPLLGVLIGVVLVCGAVLLGWVVVTGQVSL